MPDPMLHLFPCIDMGRGQVKWATKASLAPYELQRATHFPPSFVSECLI